MKTTGIIGLLLLLSFQVWADDSSYNPTVKKGSTLSLEGTGSLEIPFTGHNTASL